MPDKHSRQKPSDRLAAMTPAEEAAFGRKIFPQYHDSRRVFEMRALTLRPWY